MSVRCSRQQGLKTRCRASALAFLDAVVVLYPQHIAQTPNLVALYSCLLNVALIVAQTQQTSTLLTERDSIDLSADWPIRMHEES